MNEFARILSELIDQGKAEKQFNIQKLAEHAGITASYLSNIKQGNRKPPSYKTLVKITEALQSFGILETDIQKLIEAYNRTQLESQQKSNLLTLLIDAYHKEDGFLERLQHDIQPKGPARHHELSEARSFSQQAPLKSGLIEGDRRTLILRAVQLFEHVAKVGRTSGKIYITWFHCSTGQELHDTLYQTIQYLLNTIRSLLRTGSSFELCFLCSSGIPENFLLIQQFLEEFLGTSNCVLYETSNGPHLPQYFAVEGVGFVEARPKADDRYWIRTVVLEGAENGQSNELSALIEHFEYLLGLQDRRPVVQTMASLERFAVTPGLQKLAEAERSHFQEERLLIKNTFSTLYWPVEALRAKLQALQLPPDRIEAYLHYHLERTNTLRKRLEHGQERAIRPRSLFSPEFSTHLKRAFSDKEKKHAVYRAGFEVITGQILHVLQVITQHSNFHFALTTQDLPITLTVTGDTAFFGFDLPHPYKILPDEHHQLEAIAWTCHPEVIYHLQREFDEKWKEIDEQWRTDTEEGRRNVVEFIVTESIKVFLRANAPTQELWTFMQGLADVASYGDTESFIQELYFQEQVAKDILIVCNSLPIITMPANIGPWQPKSALRTRQRLFPSILGEIESFHVLSTQEGIEQYWDSNQYGSQTFERTWTEQHFHVVSELFTDSSDKITMELIPAPEQFPVNVEIVDREFVFVETMENDKDTGGIIFQDKELAQELLQYVERNLSAICPEHLKGTQNVVKWLEEHFGD